MKTFSEIFISLLPESLRNTLLSALLSRTGDAMEVEVSNLVESTLIKKTDITFLDKKSVVNYLAFLGVPIPSTVPSSISLNIKNGSQQDITFSIGETFTDTSEYIWTVQAPLRLSSNSSGLLLLTQYITVSTTVVYDQFISLNIEGVLADSVQVQLRNIPLKQTNNFTDGYSFYATETVIYIKIYRGVETPDPDGQDILITYKISEGLLGREPKFEVSSWRNGLILVSSSFINGSGLPTIENLQSIFKTNLLANDKLVRKTDYENFIMQDPRVAECFVVGDFERRTILADTTPTGIVDIYAITTDLLPIPTALQLEFQNLMLPYKDISITEFREPIPYRIRQYCFYTSITGDDTEFRELVTFEMSKGFDWHFVRTDGDSLFGDLDISESIYRVQGTEYSPKYLAFRFAYEQTATVLQGQLFRGDLYAPTTLELGAVAIWRKVNGSNILYAKAKATPIIAGSYEIVRVSDNTVIGTANYYIGFIEFTNIESETLDISVISAVSDVSKVSSPSLESYRISAGVNFYKGVSPTDIQLLTFNI